MRTNIRLVRNEIFYQISSFFHAFPEVGMLLIPLFTGIDFLFFDKTRSQTFLFICSVSFLANLSVNILIKSVNRIFRQSNHKQDWFHSFPSLHAQGAFGCAVVGCIFYPYYSIPFLLLASLYGYSRLVIRVHTRKEVVGGTILGIIVAASYSIYLFHQPNAINTPILWGLFFIAVIVVSMLNRYRTITEIK